MPVFSSVPGLSSSFVLSGTGVSAVDEVAESFSAFEPDSGIVLAEISVSLVGIETSEHLLVSGEAESLSALLRSCIVSELDPKRLRV